MLESICGAECTQCPSKDACGGCRESGGRPFGRECVIAACCRSGGQERWGACGPVCKLKGPLIVEFNALGIEDMAEVTDLNALPGSFVNLAYALPNGQVVRLLEDEKIYLGNQIEKKGSSRCCGIIADEDSLLVSEYGEGGPMRRSSCTKGGQDSIWQNLFQVRRSFYADKKRKSIC